MKPLTIFCALILLAFGSGACQNGGGDISGKVYFEAGQADPIPAVGATVTVSAYIENTMYTFSRTSNAQGMYEIRDIEPPGQYGMVVDFATATNMPEGFEPIGGEVGDNYTEPIGSGYQLQYGPIEIKVGSAQNATNIKNLDFTLISD